jgi:prolyl oligopeptidase
VKDTGWRHFAIDHYAPSFDNRYVAYGISPGGSEESVLRVIEVATGKETGEAIDRAQFGPPSWTDGNQLLYNRLAKQAADAPKSDKYLRSRAYVHTIGSDPERDRAILASASHPGWRWIRWRPPSCSRPPARPT